MYRRSTQSSQLMPKNYIDVEYIQLGPLNISLSLTM